MTAYAVIPTGRLAMRIAPRWSTGRVVRQSPPGTASERGSCSRSPTVRVPRRPRAWSGSRAPTVIKWRDRFARAWRAYRVQPWRGETFKGSGLRLSHGPPDGSRSRVSHGLGRHGLRLTRWSLEGPFRGSLTRRRDGP